MSLRRRSRLVTSTAAVPSADAAALCRLIQHERQLAAHDAAGVARRLSQSNRLRTERVLAVRHAACLVAAVRATRPARAAAERQRRQLLLAGSLGGSLGEQLCREEDQLCAERRQQTAAQLARWRRRLARGDAARVQAVQAEQAALLAQLAADQARLEQDIYQTAAVVVCDADLEVPAGVPAAWQWLALLDTDTQHEVRDNCAVVDCAYVRRLAAVWARHDFCAGAHDFSLAQLAGHLAVVQHWPDDVMCCWQHVERVYPPAMVGRDELITDLLCRLRPAVTRREAAATGARRRRWSAALAAHAATVHDWRLQKDVLGRQLEAQLLAWLHAHGEQQQAQRQHSVTQRRGELLRQQVAAWRQRTVQLVRERDEEAARRDAEAHTQAEAEAAREATRRDQERQHVAMFQRRRQQRDQERRQAEQSRREQQLHRQRAEAAQHEQRVQLRRDLLSRRQQQQHERNQLLAEQEAARERRLEALREDVRVTAERSPARLLAATCATWAKLGRAAEPAPAAANHSFWDVQLHCDRRVRLEGRLREAGLLDSRYARDVLRSLDTEPPPHLRPAHTWSGDGDQ